MIDGIHHSSTNSVSQEPYYGYTKNRTSLCVPAGVCAVIGGTPGCHERIVINLFGAWDSARKVAVFNVALVYAGVVRLHGLSGPSDPSSAVVILSVSEIRPEPRKESSIFPLWSF